MFPDIEIFEELANWKKEISDYANLRSWEIRSFHGTQIICRLNWNMQGQIAAIDWIEETANLAVSIALEEFKRLEKQWKKSQEGIVSLVARSIKS